MGEKRLKVMSKHFHGQSEYVTFFYVTEKDKFRIHIGGECY